MPPIERTEPGELAKCSTWYSIDGHYGEHSGVAVWSNAGERLPEVVATELELPLWYTPVEVSITVAMNVV
jgi:hypothetical protein